jgi:mono/diheme cytochrome c family protein
LASALYYKIPVPPIYKSYPIYHPAKEPPGYIKWLRQQEPQVVFDTSKLSTRSDWEAAGKFVFEDPFGDTSIDKFRDTRWYEQLNVPVSSDGIVPGWRYAVRKKGVVVAGASSCAACHSRVMPDGSLINGPQTNFPTERDFAWDIRHRRDLREARKLTIGLSFPSWTKASLADGSGEMEVDQIARLHEAIPAGVNTRIGVSVFAPPKVADLIGVKDRKYLDLIARVQHRNIGDLMRYSAVLFGFVAFFAERPAVPADMVPKLSEAARFSDEQLYALALYVYSLAPPRNPNPFDMVAARGRKVFEREGCATCHTPPLYTNNKLTLAGDFEPPESHLAKYDILPVRVGTDPRAAMQPMRGTGYYKVPSLKGVWYRGPFEHNGSVATLEDWFNPARLQDAYIPTGFKGYGVTTRSVKGHEFGLKLSSEDKRALIAFLKTL